jgi:membrane-associated phospholipid phosphatase
MAGYNIILAAVWAVLLPRATYAPWVFAAHFGASMLPWLLVRAPSTPTRLTLILREAYPLLWLPALWIELEFAIGLLRTTTVDQAILVLDLAVFGVHLDRVWLPAMPQVWFSEVMNFLYYAYYPLIFGPPIAVAVARRGDAFRDMTLRLLAVYLGCYLVYLAFPTVGPHEFGVPFEGPHQDGFFYGLVAGAHATGNVRGAAFPSSHVAGAVTIALLGWRWFSPRIAILLTVETFGVIVSTVYTQHHYAIDSLAAIVWAFAIQLLLVPLLLRTGDRRARFQRGSTSAAPATVTARRETEKGTP